MTLSERMAAASKLQECKLDWKYTTRLGLKISLFGDQISFNQDGDYIDLEEAQEAIKYLAKQFGLEVVNAAPKKNKKA